MGSQTSWQYSIKTKLIVSFSLLVSGIVGFMYVFFPYKLEQQALLLLESRAKGIAEIAAAAIQPDLITKDQRYIETIYNSLQKNADLLYIVIHNAQDKIVSSLNYNLAEANRYNMLIQKKRLNVKESVYKLSLPINHENQYLGQMFIGFSLERIKADVLATKQFVAFISLAIFIVSLIIVGALSTFFTRPLSQMVQVVNAISNGDFSQRFNITSKDEIGHLSRAFNRMVYNIQRINNAMENVNKQLQLQNEEISLQKSRLEEANRQLNKTNETMREQEARLMAILENFSGEIWSINKNYEILICNKPFQWAAEKRGAIIGMGDSALDYRQGDKYCRQWKKLYDRALIGERFTHVIENKLPNGKKQHIEYFFNPITAFNEVVGVAVLGLDITQRIEDEAEKMRLNEELNEAARRAGMAEIAASVLHNVGNVLTSITTSVSIIEQTLANTTLTGYFKATELIRENQNNLQAFISNDPRAIKLMQYFLILEDHLKSEHEQINKNLHRLQDKVNIINEVIAAQQSYATGSMLLEPLYLPEVIDDALRLQGDSADRHHIDIVKEYAEDIPLIPIQRTKMIHIIVNLYRNAKDALKDNPVDDKKILIQVTRENNKVVLRFSDNGCGIEQQHLNRIFNHGFTTKASGHGFGLHSCANYMTEMGGKIQVRSAGKGKGTSFVLEFPIPQPQYENRHKNGRITTDKPEVVENKYEQ
jgi:signal transduction histidine kinase/HAMP domain-containing protein